MAGPDDPGGRRPRPWPARCSETTLVASPGTRTAPMRRIAVLDAPSNLGLRPPTATSVPGCAKAPGALRDHGLLARLGARDAGCLTPPRYDPGDWRPGDGVCHADADRRVLAGVWPTGSARSSTPGSSRWCSAATARSCSARRWRCTGWARRRRPDRAGLRRRALRLPASRQRVVRGRRRRRGPGAGHRPRPGRPGRDRGPPAVLPGHRRGGARHPRPGRVPARPAGRRHRAPGRCRSCAPRARPGPPSGRGS